MPSDHTLYFNSRDLATEWITAHKGKIYQMEGFLDRVFEARVIVALSPHADYITHAPVHHVLLCVPDGDEDTEEIHWGQFYWKRMTP